MIIHSNNKLSDSQLSQDLTTIDHFASILIVTFNHREYLHACLSSIQCQDFPHEIIVVDNCSTDGTVDYLRENFPYVILINSPTNRGYGAGNNLAASYAKGDVLVILNPDTIVEKGWLRKLVNPIYSEDRIITTPKILTYDGSQINTCGNINHFTGLTFTRGFSADPNDYSFIEKVSGVSGACFAIKKSNFFELGGFDEIFFLYMEDSELSWRALVNNYKILTIPDSIILHHYFLCITPKKMYYLEKGRYIILMKYYTISEIFILFPSLVLAEILTLAYALKLGKLGLINKFRTIIEICEMVHMQKIKGSRKNLKLLLSINIPTNQLIITSIERKMVAIFNKIFMLNYRLL